MLKCLGETRACDYRLRPKRTVYGVLFAILFRTVSSHQSIFTHLHRFSLAGTRTPLRACRWAEPIERPLLLHLSVHVRARGSRGCNHEFNTTVTALKLQRDAVWRSRQKGKSPFVSLQPLYTPSLSFSLAWWCVGAVVLSSAVLLYPVHRELKLTG